MEGKDDTKISGRFYLQKQEESPAKFGRPGRPGLYLTNPENSNELVLAEQDFSANQTWHWNNNNELMCDTGKVLDIVCEAGPGAPLIANPYNGHGGESQKFCPFKIFCKMTEKEYCFIGRLAEQDVQGDRLFLTVPEEGTACLETVDSFHLFAKNMTNTIEMCWKFAYRQIEVKEENQREKESQGKVESAERRSEPKLEENKEEKKDEASLGDFMGVMGGLMAAFAPPEQGEEIQKQFQQMGEAMGEAMVPMFEGLAKAAEELVGYQWVKMETYKLPENALAAGKDQSDIYNVFVGRAEIDGEPCVGKVHNDTRYFGSNMREKRVTSEPFYVLCVDPSSDVEWVEYKDGDLPDGVVYGGTSRNGSNHYVGRGFVRNQLTPGMVYNGEDEHYHLHALYDGNVNKINEFEVLVIKPGAKEAIMESKEKQEKGAKEADGKAKTMRDILAEIESIEATIESEEEKYKREMDHMEEEQRKKLEKLKQELKIKRKELKDGLSMK